MDRISKLEFLLIYHQISVGSERPLPGKTNRPGSQLPLLVAFLSAPLADPSLKLMNWKCCSK